MAGGIKKAGGISFGVSMVTSQLANDTKKARTMMGGFVADTQKRLGSLRASLGGVGTALTAAFSGAAFVGFVKNQFNAIDKLNDTAQQLGVTTEALSRMGFAAEQTSTQQESLIAGLEKLAFVTKKVMSADSASGPAAGAFGSLGIDAAQLNKLSASGQFEELAEKIASLTTHQEQLNAAQGIFGKSLGADLLPLLKLGKEGLAGMAAEADRLGITIDSMDAAKVAKAADEIAKVKKQFEGIGNQLAVDLGPKAAGFAQDVATGLSVMSGGEGGETRAERALRQETALKQANTAKLTAAVKARMEARKRKEWGATLWQRAAAANAKEKRQGEAFAGMRDSVFGKVAGFGQGLGVTAQQIASGVMTSSAARMQRQNALNDIMTKSLFTGGPKASDKTWAATQRKFHSVEDFDAAKSGSLASYQQKVRGQQQFGKVEEKQLKAMEESRNYLKILADRMPTMETVG